MFPGILAQPEGGRVALISFENPGVGSVLR